MDHIDLNGLAAVIGALGLFLTTSVGVAFNVINFFDNRKAKQERDRQGQLLDTLHSDVKVLKDG